MCQSPRVARVCTAIAANPALAGTITQAIGDGWIEDLGQLAKLRPLAGDASARGANPPPALWKAPPQRTEAETDAAFERFGQYIDHIKAIPGVKFVTASDLPVSGFNFSDLKATSRILSGEPAAR